MQAISKRLFLLSLLVMLISAGGYAQLEELPVHFGQFFNNPQINPAMGGMDAQSEISLGTKQNAGVFRGVNTSFASGFLRLSNQKDSYHVIGLHFNRDAEGEILRRNRAQFSYSHHLRLSDNMRLAAGVSLGSYQFLIKSNPLTGGVSSTSFDANAGIVLYGDRGHVGLSMRQITGGSLRPLEQELVLLPQYNLIAEWDIEAAESLTLSPLASVRYAATSQDELNAGLGLSVLVSDLLHFGSSYEYDQGMHAFLGLHGIRMNSKVDAANELNIDFSLFVPQLNSSRTNINAFELTLSYLIAAKDRDSK